MSFEEWYDLHKDDTSEKVELGLSLKDLFASAYEAGLHADVHTDNSAVIAKLEAQIEQLQKINSEQKETLKKVRVALIKERTANIMNYGKGGVEMFNDYFEILKGVSND